MAVLIKGMEVSHNCWDCSVLNATACPCKNYSSALEYTTNRHPDCPLIEVPEPHGRLIDADALEYSFEPSDFWNSDAEDNCFAAVRIVHSAHTIIPASVEG